MPDYVRRCVWANARECRRVYKSTKFRASSSKKKRSKWKCAHTCTRHVCTCDIDRCNLVQEPRGDRKARRDWQIKNFPLFDERGREEREREEEGQNWKSRNRSSWEDIENRRQKERRGSFWDKTFRNDWFCGPRTFNKSNGLENLGNRLGRHGETPKSGRVLSSAC